MSETYEEEKPRLRRELLEVGAANLKERYPEVTPENLMSDYTYLLFFESMIKDELAQDQRFIPFACKEVLLEMHQEVKAAMERLKTAQEVVDAE